MTTPVTLRTERLTLRPWRDSDRAPFAALNADPAVMEHFPAPLSREESDTLADRISASLAAKGWGLWAVETPDQDFVGFVGLSEPSFEAPFTPCVEVGWRLARAAWRKGYATEAARAAVDFGFTQLGLAEIVSFTTVSNGPSQRVMQRLGMTHDPAEDFTHPNIAHEDPMSRCVLYRLAAPSTDD